MTSIPQRKLLTSIAGMGKLQPAGHAGPLSS